MGEGRNRFKDKNFEIKQQAKCRYLSGEGYHIFVFPTAFLNSCLRSESLMILVSMLLQHMFRAQGKLSKRNIKKGPDSTNIYVYSYL